MFGKLVFIAADVIQGALLIAIARYRLPFNHNHYSFANLNNRLRGVSESAATAAAAVHLLNPVAANVCSRGNADPVISCLVVTFLWLLMRRRALAAGLVYLHCCSYGSHALNSNLFVHCSMA